MKKISTLLLIFLLPLFSFAQRNADIEVIMNDPEDGLVLLEGDGFSFNVTIKNNGPDTIVLSDTINIQYIVDNYVFEIFNGTQTDTVVRHTQLFIVPGDSIVITTPPIVTNVLHGHKWCWKAFLSNTASDPIIDPNANNNKDCSDVYITPTSVNSVAKETAAKVYPIPAKGVLNWETSTLQPQQIAMYDVNGKAVYKTAPTTNRGQIDVSNVAKGLYYIQIAGGDGNIVSQKVLVE